MMNSISNKSEFVYVFKILIAKMADKTELHFFFKVEFYGSFQFPDEELEKMEGVATGICE